MDEAEMRKNADFLIKNLVGKEVPGNAKVSIRYKPLVSFAKIYGITDPKYVGPEEDGIVACHGFANHYTVKAIYKLLIGMKLVQDGVERPFMLNTNKLLHGGQKYDWDGCVDVKPGDRLTMTAIFGKTWLVEETMVLFSEIHVTVKNRNDELVCKPLILAAVRPGGY